jgi:16S rRNA (guanine527-N7)-methyltransferase
VAKRDLGQRIQRRARKARVSISADLAERLAAYVALLMRWNERMNLTGLDDSDGGIDRLVVEALVAVQHLPSPDASIMDIGSGGGSPAVPMKLAAPDSSLLMVEPKTRKAAFLREAVRVLELPRTEVETARYEQLLSRADLHESRQVVTLRAVRAEARLLRGLQAFLAPGGFLMLFRGPGGQEAAELLQPPLVWHATYPLIESQRSRLVVLRKVATGPAMANK